MKLSVKILVGFCILITSVFIIGRLTNAIQFYRIPTTANEPAMKVGSYCFASNLVTPQLFDFICFRYSSEQEGNHNRVYRLCGRGSDKIEIKDGTLFVNKKDADKNLNLYHAYSVGIDEFNILNDKLKFTENQYYQYGNDRFLIYTNEKILKENNVTGTKQSEIFGKENEGMEELWKKKWNADNFGPVTVPPGKYFVMGDNRDNAQDSRYIGFIDEEDVIGTVLDKH